MAKQYSFAYKDWSLGRDKHKAIAVRGKGNDRQKVQLGVPYRPEAAARAALIAYVDSLERMTHKGDPTVGLVLDRYLEKLEAEGKPTRTISVQAKRLRPFFGSLLCSHVTDVLCQRYAKEMSAADYAHSTIWTDLGILRTALKWCHEKRRELLSFPAHTACWNVLAPTTTRQAMTPEQVHDLLAGTGAQHIRLFILFALFTSARLQAIVDLKWSQVDLERRVIDFRVARNSGSVMDKSYKKGRAVVHIGDLLFAALTAAKTVATTPYVLEYQGNHVHNVYTGFKAAVARSGVPNWVTPHVLRHTAATWADGDGKLPIEITAKLLGHKNPSTTRNVYAHPEAEATRPAVEKIEKKFGRGLKVVR